MKHFALLLNSTLWFLFLEIYGSGNLGEGALVFNTKNFRKLKIPEIKKTDLAFKQESHFFSRTIRDIFTETGFNPAIPIRSQMPDPLPDRKELDNKIFDALKLTSEQRNEVYWSLAELVKQRLNKAASR
jgi:hypothetical protein